MNSLNNKIYSLKIIKHQQIYLEMFKHQLIIISNNKHKKKILKKQNKLYVTKENNSELIWEKN